MQNKNFLSADPIATFKIEECIADYINEVLVTRALGIRGSDSEDGSENDDPADRVMDGDP